jgi:hypothetical protein
MILLAVLFFSILLFYFGFYKLGKFTNSKLLKFSSISIIITIIVSVILVIWMIFILWSVVSGLLAAGTASMSGGSTGQMSGIMTQLIIFFSLSILVWLFFSVVQILFSVGLIKIRNQVKFSAIAGILSLIISIISILSFFFCVYLTIKIFADISFAFSAMLFMAEHSTLFSVLEICFGILGLATFISDIIILFYGSKNFEK